MFGASSRSRVGIAAVIVALVGVLAACGAVEEVLSAEDKNRFVDSANAFISANNDLQTDISPATMSPQEMIDIAEPKIDEMESALGDMKSIVGDLSGEARTVGDEAITAAEEVLASSEDFVAALEVEDLDALTAASEANSQAIDDFNAAASKWNAL